MELGEVLWSSRNKGYKKLIMLMPCLALLIVGLALTLASTTVVSVAVLIVALIISATVLLIGKFTNLKWNTANFLFIAAESGFYMTSANPRLQGSYFHAEWSEIVGYSVKSIKNDKATVAVYFDGPADCGFLGKNTSLDMVNITGLETLRTVFSNYNIAERNATK